MKIKTAVISLLFVPFLVFAQNGTLPSAGLTPESPFYFVDTLGEVLREFFTFNPEGKARLQITFAAERVAEIKVILETKGVEAKGLEIAEARLREHLGNAAEIVIKQKGEGKDISKLAKELNDGSDEVEDALQESFKEKERALEAREEALEKELKEARLAGDTAKIEALAQELANIEAQKELLEQKEEELENKLEAEKEKLEREMEDKEEAGEAIKEAEEEKQEVLDEAKEEGIELPAGVFTKFDRLLAQAKELFAKENFQGAEQLAKQAEKSLDGVDEAIEKLEEEKEQKEERRQEEVEDQSNENGER